MRMVSPEEQNPEATARRRAVQKKGLRIDLNKSASSKTSGLNVPL